MFLPVRATIWLCSVVGDERRPPKVEKRGETGTDPELLEQVSTHLIVRGAAGGQRAVRKGI